MHSLLCCTLAGCARRLRLKASPASVSHASQAGSGVAHPAALQVKLSNMMRVLGGEAVADPTALEAQIRAAQAERLQVPSPGPTGLQHPPQRLGQAQPCGTRRAARQQGASVHACVACLRPPACPAGLQRERPGGACRRLLTVVPCPRCRRTWTAMRPAS